MAPLLENGDSFLVRSASPPLSSPPHRRGAVILFRQGGALIVHRIIGVREREGGPFYCQKGDNAAETAWIPAASVLGRVCSVSSRRGRIDLDDLSPALISVLMLALGAGQRFFNDVYRRFAPDGIPTRLPPGIELLRRIQIGVFLRLGRGFSGAILGSRRILAGGRAPDGPAKLRGR